MDTSYSKISSPNYINLVGKTFGDLIVIKKTDLDTNGQARFLCECKCKQRIIVRSVSLRGGKRTRCNDCKKEKTKLKNQQKTAQKRHQRGFEILQSQYDKHCEREAEEINKILKKEKAQTETQRLYKNSEYFKCYNCKQALERIKFSEASLKGRNVICKRCSKEVQREFTKKMVEFNLKQNSIKCKECEKNTLIEGFSKRALRYKKPTCKKCEEKVDQKKGDDLYKKRQESGGDVKCYGCKKNLPLNFFYKSALRQTCCRCKKCFSKYNQEYKKKRIKQDPIYKEKSYIGKRINKSLRSLNLSFKKGTTASEYLGVSKNEFIDYIESQFREGMSWDNREEWHLDHINPISNAATEEEVKALWYYTNLQPLWAWENEEKSDKLNWQDLSWANDVIEVRKKLGYLPKLQNFMQKNNYLQ